MNSNMAKTNEGLAIFAENCVGNSPYLFGTFGQILTERLLAQKKSDYPAKISDSRYQYARSHFIGKRCNDCYGFIKRYKWTEPGVEKPDINSTPIYNPSEDRTADMAYKAAKVKGDISTIPEVRGIIVHMKGHVGVYIGNGWVVEARGFDYGTVKTRLKDRKWLHWFEETGIDYKSAPIPSPTPTPTPTPKPQGGTCIVEMPIIKKAMNDEIRGSQVVKTLQACLNNFGYGLEIDASFGGKTDSAVRDFQKKKGLTVDGIVGQKTWSALLK